MLRIYFFLFIYFLSCFFVFCQNNEGQLVLMWNQKKEFDKSILYLRKLYEQDPLFWFEHYYQALIGLKEWDKAEKLCKTQLKADKPHTYPLVYLGNIYKIQGKQNKAAEFFNKAIQNSSTQDFPIRKLAETFIRFEEFDFALKTYQRGASANPNYPYFYEKADIYKQKGDLRAMINEYLDAVEYRETELYNVQVHLSNSLGYDDQTGGFKNPILKEELLKRIQKKNQSVVLTEFLIFVLNQQKEFYQAYVQCKALDKRQNEQGARLYQQARICIDNEDFENARLCLDYIASLKNSPFRDPAEFLLSDLLFRELEQTIQPSPEKVQQVVQLHKQLSERNKNNSEWPELMMRLALLYSKYQRKHEEAVNLLEPLTTNASLPLQIRGKIKMKLADILLQSGRIWDAALLYGQLDKEFKNDIIGHEAKFKNAKIYFFTGEFRLAKSQADVLKGSTSKLTANDALELSLIISDGIGLDTNSGPLQYYARACLYFESYRPVEAIAALDSIDKVFSTHTIHDHVQFLKIKILVHYNQYDTAMELLKNFTEKYPESIHIDDALLLYAKLFYEHKKDKENSMKTLEILFEKYPGSVLIHSARNMYRKIRGDYNKQT